jgi:hypothetical protein
MRSLVMITQFGYSTPLNSSTSYVSVSNQTSSTRSSKFQDEVIVLLHFMPTIFNLHRRKRMVRYDLIDSFLQKAIKHCIKCHERSTHPLSSKSSLRGVSYSSSAN